MPSDFYNLLLFALFFVTYVISYYFSIKTPFYFIKSTYALQSHGFQYI